MLLKAVDIPDHVSLLTVDVDIPYSWLTILILHLSTVNLLYLDLQPSVTSLYRLYIHTGIHKYTLYIHLVFSKNGLLNYDFEKKV